MLLMQHSLEVGLESMPIAPPNPALIKWKEAYWCYFSAFLLVTTGKVSADALVHTCAIVHIDG